MFALISKFFLQGGIGQILSALQKAHEARLKAQNDADRLAADISVKALEAQLEIAKNAAEIRASTSGFFEMRIVTFLIALPFVLHLWAVAADTIFKLGWAIPAFPQPFAEWQGAILLSFFGIYTLGRGVQTVAAAILKRKK